MSLGSLCGSEEGMLMSLGGQRRNDIWVLRFYRRIARQRYSNRCPCVLILPPLAPSLLTPSIVTPLNRNLIR